MKWIKKIGKWLLKAGLILLITLLIFEIFYRYNLIDFYKTELSSLNDLEAIEKSSKKRLLIFGDSFSADNSGYVRHLRDEGDWEVINCAVSGISFKQIRLFLEDRIEEFEPDGIILQLYVGNDFQDYHHSRNWTKLSFVRNMYSFMSDRLIGIQYLNYKLGGIYSTNAPVDPKDNLEFNKESYNHREKRYFLADPACLKNAIQLNGDQLEIYEEMKDDLLAALQEVNIPILLLVVPHAAQVSNKYRKNMIEIGADLPLTISVGEFKFYEQLKEDLKSLKSVKVVSPLLNFRLKIKRNDLYYPNDPHLTDYGQGQLFEFISSKLKSIT